MASGVFEAHGAESLVDKTRGFRSHGIDFAVDSPLGVVEVGRFAIPLALGDDVADFIIGQAKDESDRSRHQFAERWDLDRFQVEVSARGAFNAPVDKFGVNLSGNTGDAGITQTDQGHFGAQLHPAGMSAVHQPENRGEQETPIIEGEFNCARLDAERHGGGRGLFILA